MRAKRVSREQFALIMECRGSGLSDYQWCMANDILPGTFYMWISRLRKAGYTIPDSVARQKAIPVNEEATARQMGRRGALKQRSFFPVSILHTSSSLCTKGLR